VALQENQHIEFKSTFSDEVVETLVAFANSKGGKVLIGVNNKGEPINDFSIGSESIQNWINQIKTKTQPSVIPDVETVEINGVERIALTIRGIQSNQFHSGADTLNA
jgi:ATP-dependent DNA helicase RecG